MACMEWGLPFSQCSFSIATLTPVVHAFSASSGNHGTEQGKGGAISSWMWRGNVMPKHCWNTPINISLSHLQGWAKFSPGDHRAGAFSGEQVCSTWHDGMLLTGDQVEWVPLDQETGKGFLGCLYYWLFNLLDILQPNSSVWPSGAKASPDAFLPPSSSL